MRRTARVLVVDDDPVDGYLIAAHLGDAGYGETFLRRRGQDSLDEIRDLKPDAILLGLATAENEGYTLLRRLCDDSDFGHLGILVLTDSDDREARIRALRLGATDYLTKPVDPLELLPRIDNALIRKAHRDLLAAYADEMAQEVRRKTVALEASQLRIVYCLARAAEYRDNETGQHVIRVSQYAALIAEQLGLSSELVDLIKSAAPLHDLGKIGVPDAILLKPGKFEPDEWGIMKRHCEIGREILEPPTEDQWRAFCGSLADLARVDGYEEPCLLQVAARIASCHHEKWDGSGYPRGLRGTQIPLEARITAVADVFDALGAKRPYKESLTLTKSLEIMEEGRGTHFDPRVLDAFYDRIEDAVTIMTRIPDEASPHLARSVWR